MLMVLTVKTSCHIIMQKLHKSYELGLNLSQTYTPAARLPTPFIVLATGCVRAYLRTRGPSASKALAKEERCAEGISASSAAFHWSPISPAFTSPANRWARGCRRRDPIAHNPTCQRSEPCF
uniref:Uncharacterized protein n=1 Tax=Echinococcus granulosus TaxID=6210 RepID=A0A068WP06_ECHGR|nr:hypothetical protein EgrG_000194100 [Echinococcus granulosus]